FEKGPLFYITYNIRLFFKLLASKQDLLVSNDLDTLLPNFLISKLRNIPLIYDSHEYFTETPELVGRPLIQKIWKTLEAQLVSRLPEMITVNESIANLFRKKYNIRVHVVRNVPLRLKNKPTVDRKHLGLPEDRTILLMQGSGINIQRGAEELVESMLYLENCLLLIIGGGDVLEILKETSKKLQLDDKIKFLGKMPYQQMMQFTQLADFGFTLDKDTNLNYRYSLPNKLFDYIQANTPVIASNLPEVRKIVETFHIGRIIESHTPKNIAELIRECIEDKDLMKEWENNLTFAAQTLCWENEEKVLLKVYEQYH
ncbi:MAG TPA: glycosyltransferase, partial [Bacteroidales bacterium]|nr:glycosyltransferase [Bacteroidales bacterium]